MFFFFCQINNRKIEGELSWAYPNSKGFAVRETGWAWESTWKLTMDEDFPMAKARLIEEQRITLGVLHFVIISIFFKW
jgi:hypothetical protein